MQVNDGKKKRGGLLGDEFAKALANIPTPVQGLWFNGQRVALDGYSFDSCRFDNCELLVFSLNFQLRRCYVDPQTRIIYGKDALKLIKLFNSRTEWVYQQAPVFAPERHEDGTISIR